MKKDEHKHDWVLSYTMIFWQDATKKKKTAYFCKACKQFKDEISEA